MGITTKFKSVEDPKEPQFIRNPDKKEADIDPDELGRITVDREFVPPKPVNPYMVCINNNIQKEDMPKITFKSRAFYEQSLAL